VFDYPLTLTPDDNGTFLVTCPDLPEVTTFGETEEECLRMGALAVGEAVAARLARFQDVPPPGDAEGPRVALDLQLSVKLLLMRALREDGKTRADLQRALGLHRPQIDRLFDPTHATRLDQYEAAFRAIGRRIDMVARPSA
jgi:antitoxin HicB